MQTALARKPEESKARAAPAPQEAPELSAAAAMGALAGTPLFLRRFQAKPEVNEPGDVWEQEADGVASAVMRKEEPAAAGDAGEDEEEVVQRKPAVAGPSPSGLSIPLPDSGAPLSGAVRERIEPVLGADLSSVHVHTSPAARESARSLRAKAFTYRNHIWVGPGQSADDVELMAHEATHVVQQGAGHRHSLVQRQPDGGASQSGKAADDAALLAEEDKAFLEVQLRSGKPALDLVLSFPARQPVARETLTIVGFASRVGADPPRRAFDSASAAAAYASVAAGGSGAAVLQQGKFFFVALLGGGSSFRREEVWKVEPYLGVTAAIGADGASFPLGVELQPGADKARLYDPNMAGPATADALRAIAGVTIEEDRMRDAEAAKHAAEEGRAAPAARKTEKVALSPAEEEAFIVAYFRARGIEVLEQNREMVEKLAKDFSPTSKGDVNTPSSGVSSSARDLIDSSRKLGAQYRELLEAEATLEKYLSLVQQRRSFRGSGWTIKVDGKEQVIALWLDDLEKMQKRIADQKSSLLSRMPMLAQMVGAEREAPNDMGLLDQFA